ncbi:hypothetical protein CLU79DRAFT_832230 [Phycomyces nitens]|nr:hypothetical protein CLU79DRAFT_832230 [Phycomyces nitens]
MHTTVEWTTKSTTNIWLLVANNNDKLPIWHYIWSTYVIPSQDPTALPSLQLALTSLSPPARSSPHAMFAITVALEAILRSYWAFIFKDASFRPSQVESLIDKLVRKAQQESFLNPNMPTHLSHFSTSIGHCSKSHAPSYLGPRFLLHLISTSSLNTKKSIKT